MHRNEKEKKMSPRKRTANELEKYNNSEGHACIHHVIKSGGCRQALGHLVVQMSQYLALTTEGTTSLWRGLLPRRWTVAALDCCGSKKRPKAHPKPLKRAISEQFTETPQFFSKMGGTAYKIQYAAP